MDRSDFLGTTISTCKLCFWHPDDQIQCILISVHVMYVCAHGCVGASAWAQYVGWKVWHRVSSSLTIVHISFWDSVSHWTRKSPILPDDLAPKITSPPHQHCRHSGSASFLSPHVGAVGLNPGTYAHTTATLPREPFHQPAIFGIICSPLVFPSLGFLFEVLPYSLGTFCFYCLLRTSVQET